MQLQRIERAPAAEKDEVRNRADLRIGALGSGSDYTAFLDHLGVASLNLAFGGEDGGGIYHSIYDDFYWYTHFADSDFVYGRALAQTAGTAMMRLADADLLPFDFADFRRHRAALRRRSAEALEGRARCRSTSATSEIDEGRVQRHRRSAQDARAAAGETDAAVSQFRAARKRPGRADPRRRATTIKRAQKAKLDRAGPGSRERQARFAIERGLTLPDGLPSRPWFQHQIYAPGFTPATA